MLSANVGGIDVVKENIDVVNSVVSRRVVDRERTFDVLLDDVSISVECRGFNLMKRPFQLISGNGLNLSTAPDGGAGLLAGKVGRSQIRDGSVNG